MRRQQGFSLIELLLAFFIFGIILGIASSAIIQYLGIQSDQEALTSAQARLRRVTEVISQELRSAALGGIIDTPGYPSNKEQVSFAMLEGAAGYQIASTTTTTSTLWSTAANDADLGLAVGDQVMMVSNRVVSSDADGAVVLRNVSAVNKLAGGQWSLSHTSCTLPALNEPIAFKVQTLRYSFDKANKQILGADGQPLAFNITDFIIKYVYVDNTDAVQVKDDFLGRTLPGGFALKRLELTLASQELSKGKTLERRYSSQIDLSDSARYAGNNAYLMGDVTICF